MDRIKEKMSQLRIECDEANTKNDELKKRVKDLEQENLTKEQEITSLSHKNQVLETDVEKLEKLLGTAKAEAAEGSQAGTQAESLQRRLQVLEEEAEKSDQALKDLNEKHRQTDVKAGHYERKVAALEQERDQWESKYEEMAKKYADVKKELDDFIGEIGTI